jgi:hypothetical protein
MKAILMTCDRYRALTDHMIAQYDMLWPDHPFTFRIPYQQLRDADSPRREYIKAPGGTASDIPPSVLELIADLDDEEWIYWVPDDKYPIKLVLTKITRILAHVLQDAEASGLLYCRCRVTLSDPELTLLPKIATTPDGDVLLERKAWYQFWIHQFVRVKALRYFFSRFPKEVPSAKGMDEIKKNIPKLPEHHLFVTKENLAIFGESTHGGVITRNCYDSIRKSGIELPEWFQQPGKERVTMGEL